MTIITIPKYVCDEYYDVETNRTIKIENCCDCSCPFFDLNNEKIPCIIQASKVDGNCISHPLAKCPGPGIYELVKIGGYDDLPIRPTLSKKILIKYQKDY